VSSNLGAQCTAAQRAPVSVDFQCEMRVSAQHVPYMLVRRLVNVLKETIDDKDRGYDAWALLEESLIIVVELEAPSAAEIVAGFAPGGYHLGDDSTRREHWLYAPVLVMPALDMPEVDMPPESYGGPNEFKGVAADVLRGDAAGNSQLPTEESAPLVGEVDVLHVSDENMLGAGVGARLVAVVLPELVAPVLLVALAEPMLAMLEEAAPVGPALLFDAKVPLLLHGAVPASGYVKVVRTSDDFFDKAQLFGLRVNPNPQEVAAARWQRAARALARGGAAGAQGGRCRRRAQRRRFRRFAAAAREIGAARGRRATRIRRRRRAERRHRDSQLQLQESVLLEGVAPLVSDDDVHASDAYFEAPRATAYAGGKPHISTNLLASDACIDEVLLDEVLPIKGGTAGDARMLLEDSVPLVGGGGAARIGRGMGARGAAAALEQGCRRRHAPWAGRRRRGAAA